MAISTTLDVTPTFSTGGSSSINIDVSGWDTAVVQLVSPSGSINFLSSNDGGAITGVTDGNATSAANFTAVQGVNLATGAAATLGGVSGLWKISGMGRYLQLSGSSITATKVLVELSKID